MDNLRWKVCQKYFSKNNARLACVNYRKRMIFVFVPPIENNGKNEQNEYYERIKGVLT